MGERERIANVRSGTSGASMYKHSFNCTHWLEVMIEEECLPVITRALKIHNTRFHGNTHTQREVEDTQQDRFPHVHCTYIHTYV